LELILIFYAGDFYDAGYIPSSAEEKDRAKKLQNATEADPSVCSMIEDVSVKSNLYILIVEN
jgi:hypothetical protein